VTLERVWKWHFTKFKVLRWRETNFFFLNGEEKEKEGEEEERGSPPGSPA
jgi:hypothetical protein